MPVDQMRWMTKKFNQRLSPAVERFPPSAVWLLQTMPSIVPAADGPTKIGLRAREQGRGRLHAHSARLLRHLHPMARTAACVSRLDTLSG